MHRLIIVAVACVACAMVTNAQTTDPGNERTQQPSGESGAAKSHTLTPGSLALPHEILGTAHSPITLSADQRNRLRAYFTENHAQDP
jgi:hypothetical protein